MRELPWQDFLALIMAWPLMKNETIFMPPRMLHTYICCLPVTKIHFFLLLYCNYRSKDVFRWPYRAGLRSDLGVGVKVVNNVPCCHHTTRSLLIRPSDGALFVTYVLSPFSFFVVVLCCCLLYCVVLLCCRMLVSKTTKTFRVGSGSNLDENDLHARIHLFTLRDMNEQIPNGGVFWDDGAVFARGFFLPPFLSSPFPLFFFFFLFSSFFFLSFLWLRKK